MIAILDYGMGNLRSVQKAFECVGHAAEITSDPKRAARADKLILPGVGAFRDAIARLRTTHLDETVLEHIRRGKPFLGICLGLQLLFERSHEDGLHEGLGIFRGDVVRFAVKPGLKVPHMGWNTVAVQKDCPLFQALPEPSVYFVHGYHCKPMEDIVAGTTDYDGEFASVIWKDNVMATQFHPEKSQSVGLAMLKNYAVLNV